MNTTKLPDGWTTVELGLLADLYGGGTPSRKAPSYFKGDIPWLTGYDLPEDAVESIYEGRELITRDAIKESATSLVPAGTVLLTTRVTVGKVAVTEVALCFSQDLTGIVIKERDLLDPYYLGYYLFSQRQHIEHYNRGSTISGVTRSDVAKIFTLLPPISEQRLIVDILRQAGELRRLRRRTNDRARDLLPALFQAMFGIGREDADLPPDWTVIDLGSLFKSTQYGLSVSLSADTGDVGVLRMNNISADGYLDFQDLKFVEGGVVDWQKYDLQPGDILFNRTNSVDLVGKTAIWERPHAQDYTFASYIIRVRLVDDVVPLYVWAFMNSSIAKRQLARLAKRAVNMANINTGELASLRIGLPPKEMQQRFAHFYDLHKAHQHDLTLHEQKLTTLSMSLLSQAFTGELTATWRATHTEQQRQEASERDQRLGARPKRLLTREHILRSPDSRDMLAAETTLAKALDEVAQQLTGSTKLLSSTLETLAHSPAMAMAQQIQRQYTEVFGSLGLRAIRQIADDQQRILAAMVEPLRQMTAQVSKRMMEDLLPAQGILMQFAEMAKLALAEPDPSHPRYHLLRSLSREQHGLYLALQTSEGYLRPETMAEESGLPLDTVQRDLELLVTIGLVQRINVATKPSDKLVYVPAYRRVRPSDNARQTMMERLAPQESAP